MATAMVVPAAGLGATQSLRVASELDGWVVAAPDGAAFTLPAHLVFKAVAIEHRGGVQWAAYVVGDAGVAAGRAVAMPLAPDPPLPAGSWTRSSVALPLIPSTAVLVSPQALTDTSVDAAWVKSEAGRQAALDAGLLTAPATGTAAFALQGIEQVRQGTWLLVLLTIPVVAFVGLAFADLEARDQLRRSGVLAALGRPGLASVLLVLRLGVLVALAAGVACLVAVGVLAKTGSVDRSDLPLLALVALPGLAGWLLGSWRMHFLTRGAAQTLRTAATVPRSPLLPGLNPLRQPLVLGLRALPGLCLAALLFVADVGFPLAIGAVPASFTGPPGELTVTSTPEAVLTGRTLEAFAGLSQQLPQLDAAVAEVLVLTSIASHPILLRGSSWPDAKVFHDLRLERGSSPNDGELVLGTGAARRLELAVGDSVLVPASQRAYAVQLRVVGVYAATQPFDDEGWVSLPTGRDLAGLGPDAVTVVRFKPETVAALSALAPRTADVQLVNLRVEPDPPVAGAPVTVRLDAVNLGSVSGRRDVALRFDGVAVATQSVLVPAQSAQAIELRAIAPPHAFRLDVNPTRTLIPAANPWTLEAPALVFDDTGVRVVARRDGIPAAGVTVSLLHADGRLVANAQTDENGSARFAPQRVGHYTARLPDDAAASMVVGAAADRTRAKIVVESVWTAPSRLPMGATAQAFALVRNVGGVAGTQAVSLTLDGAVVAAQPATVESGATAVVGVYLTPAPGRHVFGAGNRTASLDVAFAATAPLPPAPGSPVHQGQTLARHAADEVLGNTRTVLVGLGVTALLSSMALSSLALLRVLASRADVLPVLGALGLTAAQLRRRIAAEAAALGVVAGGIGLLVAVAAFALSRWLQMPLAFGHTLPTPVTPLFCLQVLVGMGTVAGVAAYVASRSWVERATRRPGAPESDAVDAVSLPQLLGDTA